MSAAEWGLALPFCPWDLNTVHPAIISLACALPVVCHRTVSFPFYSSYLRHKFSAIWGPDRDESHMHSQTKAKIKVVLAVKNVPVYPNPGVVLSLVHKSVPFTALLLSCTIWSCSWVLIKERKECSGYPLSSLQIWAVLPTWMLSRGTQVSPRSCLLCQSLQISWTPCSV